MGGVQFLLAWLGFYTIASFLAGLAGLGMLLFLLRRNSSPVATAGPNEDGPPLKRETERGIWALIPYGLLVAIVVLGQTVLADVLDFAIIRASLPEVETSLGWVVPAGPGRSINIFGHGGALLIYTIILTFLIYKAQGRFKAGAGRRIVRDTLRGGLRSSVGILTMVGMAVMMENTGMTRLLAEGISRAVGGTFPIAAPLIGALGAFMTGSNTNSNVVFAAMQEQTALILGFNPLIILAAQTTGGAIGALFAPAKVIVGCSTVNLGGREGKVLKDAIIYGMAILIVICLATWVVT
jgi:lactate permease